MSDDLGPWEPLGVDELVGIMSATGVRWWFTGGRALELHLGRSWREHDDIDVSLCRSDVPRLTALQPDWEISLAAAGELRPWDGRVPSQAAHENNLWVRRPGGPWCFDVTVGDGDDDRWIYRRDRTFSMPWDRVIRHDRKGRPYLTPSVQLVFKSANVRPKDDVDAEVVIPELDPWSLAVLDARLTGPSSWRTLVEHHRPGMSGPDVLEVLDLLGERRIDAWVDGGWGIDALLGAEHRPHADLDLALPTRQWGSALEVLGGHGFELVRDDGRFNVVVIDDRGRSVDLHAFDDEHTVVGPDGLERHGPNGLAYLAGGFGGQGLIEGRVVRCMTADFQMWSHTGYEVDDGDFADVSRLHERFDLPIPTDYARWVEHEP